MRLAISRTLAIALALDAFVATLPWIVLTPFLKMVGFTPVDYGLFLSIAMASSIVSMIIAGPLIDRLRALTVLAITYTASTVSLLLMATGIKALILAGSAINGLFHFSYMALSIALSKVYPSERYDEMYSHLYSMSLIGESAGAFAGWIPYEVSKLLSAPLIEVYRWAIVVGSLASLSTLSLIAISEIAHVRGGGGGGWRSVVGMFRELDREVLRRVALLILVGMPQVLGSSMAVRSAGYYFVAKYSVQSNALGTLRGVEDALMGCFMPLMPRLRRRLGSSIKTYALVSSACVPLMVGITFVNSFPIAAAIFVARTVLANVASPLYAAFEMRILPPEVRGRALSLIRLVNSGVSALGSFLGGVLMSMCLEYPFRVAAALYAITYVGMATVLARLERSVESAQQSFSGVPT